MTTEITRFDNGIRFVSEHMPHLLSAAIGIRVARGARHERAEQNGVAHFLEHMAFKGTKTRSARDIAEAIEDVGGDLNAFTEYEATTYHASVLKEDVPLALDVLSDIILHPQFSEAEVESERNVILQEMAHIRDSDDAMLFENLLSESFPGQALGRPIIGDQARVKRFRAEDFISFMAENYGPENIVISAAGGVDHQSLARDIEKRFASIPYQSANSSEVPRFSPGLKRIKKRSGSAHFGLALQAPAIGEEGRDAAHLVAMILGGGMSSRLFQSIREEMGLCYAISASVDFLSDIGQFIIYSASSKEGIGELMRQSAREMKGFAAKLEEKEIARAKAQARAGSVLALEGALGRAGRIASEIGYFDKITSIEERLARLDAVGADEVVAMAEELFSREPQIVVTGPIRKALDYDGFMAEFH